MTDTKLTRAIRYGAHSSTTKETTFVRKELQEQAQAGHIALFPLRAVIHLPKLWLYPLAAIPQRDRKPRLIYNFSWSGLNKAVTQVAHKEAMRFGEALYRVIDCILNAPPELGPTFLNKVDLSDAYMRIWVRLKDIPSVALLVPKATPEEDQLIGFHLSIPMWYVESASFFCAITETVKDGTLDTLSMRHTAPPHHLENLAETKPPEITAREIAATLVADKDWEALSPHAQDTALAHVEVYLNDFIGITQGGAKERRQMTRHLFRTIDELFRLNNKDYIAREEPISLKKLRKGNAAWSTKKVILGRANDTAEQVLTLPDDRKASLLSLLDTSPP